jgi:hypothetical protein
VERVVKKLITFLFFEFSRGFFFSFS